jgi:gluconate 2-dehydrogenase gamma chain
MADQLITRRETFKYLGLLTATAAGREFLAKWLPAASNSPGARSSGDLVTMPGMHHAPPPQAAEPYTPQFFKPHEFQTVEILAEMIIPTDDKPGAKEAQVANYIDFVVFSAAEFEPSLQREWSKGLARLDRESKRLHGKSFRELSAADREELMMDMSLPERESTGPPRPHTTAAERDPHPGFEFYKLVKEMTVEGFYSSRVGLIDVLEYKGRTFLSEFPGCTHPEHQA